jgi:hypothetical protein
MEHFTLVKNLYEDVEQKFHNAKTPEDYKEVIKASTHFLTIWKKSESKIVENCIKMVELSKASL